MLKTRFHKYCPFTPMLALLSGVAVIGSCGGDEAKSEDAPAATVAVTEAPAEKAEPEAPPANTKPGEKAASPVDERLKELIKELSAHDWRMRKKAAEQLASMGEEAKDAVPDLIKALTDKDEEVRAAASVALGAIGKEAVIPIIEMIERTLGKEVFDPKLVIELKEDEWKSVLLAVKALKKMGKDSRNAADTLMRVIKAKCTSLSETPSCFAAQGTASDTMGLIGAGAVPVLMQGLNVTDPIARAEIAQALGKLGSDAKEAVPVLANMLNGEQSAVCDAAAMALSGIGEPAIPTLLAALHEMRPMVREPAVKALIKMGPPAKTAIPELEKLLNDPKKWTRRAAEEVLEKIK